MNRMIPPRETLEIEFKSDQNKLPDSDLIDAVVGFANTNGGDLYLGVEDNGDVTGLHPSHRDITQLAAFIANKTIPPVSVRVEMIDAEAPVIMIHVPQYRSIVASSAGKIQRRRIKADGTPENVPMYPFEINTRLSELSLLDFSAQPVPGALYADFDPLERERLRRMILTYNGERALLELPDDELDKALQLAVTVNGQLVPTYAGMLLIGRQQKIRELMPTAEAAFQMLRGTEVSVNESFFLPLLAAAERIMDFIDARNPEQEMEMGMYRMSIPEFDKRAVREAVINAFAHRDYRVPGAVMVKQYSDELTISSPGELIGGITPENILHHAPVSRNNALANILEKLRLVNRSNLGVPRIYSSMLAEGKGEILKSLPQLSDFAEQPAILLCKPDVGVSTGRAYAAVDGCDSSLLNRPDAAAMQKALAAQDVEGVADHVGNVFEQVLRIEECETIKTAMLSGGALGACMTGSGTTVFGIFDSAEAAKQCAFTLKKTYTNTFVTHAEGCGCRVVSDN